ncbi:AhpA/YtjB family protein [Ningiella sp. W23]|uniref:AhpA/YtjB family protein n=1 Tax=Ningiella sp. W23 TaxID=3023715 RepID=UPI0037563CDC
MITQHNKSIFKRLSSLVLLVCSVAIAINLYIMHAKSAQQWYEIESEQLGRSLTLQAAKLLSQPMSDKDNVALNQYIDMLNSGMFIEGAVVFDQMGVKLSDEDNRFSVIEMMSEKQYEPLVFVEDIVLDNTTLGYIKLILNRDEITEHHQEFNRNQLSQSILTIVMTIIISVLLTRFFYKFKYSYLNSDGLADAHDGPEENTRR